MQPLSTDFEIFHETSFSSFDPASEGWSSTRTSVTHGTAGMLSRHDGEMVEKTFDLEPNTDSVVVEFQLFELGQWDAETFSIHINGRQIDLQQMTYKVDEGAYILDMGDGIVLEKSVSGGIYSRELHNIRLTIEDPGDALTLGFSSNLDGSLEGGYLSDTFEAWGVDNLQIHTKPGTPEEPAEPSQPYLLFDDGSSPVQSVTYDAETGVLDLVIDQEKLFQDSGEWGNVRHIDYLRYDGQMYEVNIHGDDGPRNPDGSYIYDETTTENVFSINIGAGHDPVDGIMNFEFHDYADGSKKLYEFQMTNNLGEAPEGLVAAVNAGGGEYTTIEGITYAADTSGVRSYSEGKSIEGTLSDTIYTSENSSWGGFTLETELANGFYDVELKFAEIWGGAQEAGVRTFDLKVEDEFAFQNLDLTATAGYATALDFVGTVEVKDGALTIEGINGVNDAKISGYSIWETDATEATAFEIGNILDYRAEEAVEPAPTAKPEEEDTPDEVVFIDQPAEEPTAPTSPPSPFAEPLAPTEEPAKPADYETLDEVGFIDEPTEEPTGPTLLPSPFAEPPAPTEDTVEPSPISPYPLADEPIEMPPFQTDTSDLVAAVNTGGGDYTTAGGVTYVADTSGMRSYTSGDSIAATEDDVLYQSETSQWNGFVYETEVENGLYDVELKFAEIWHGAQETGVRTFDVKVEDEFVFKNLDLTEKAGYATAFDYVGTVEVTDGVLTIEGINGANWAKIAGFSIWESDRDEAAAFNKGANLEDYRANPTNEVSFIGAEPVDELIFV